MLHHLCRQDVAFTHIGYEAAVALPEADQNPPLGLDVAHGQARLSPVVAGVGLQRRQFPLRRQFFGRQVIQQHTLFEFELGCNIQVLQRTGAAGTVMRAERR